MHWSDIVGWFGFAVVLGSYLMVALQRWHVRSFKYQLACIIGSSLLGINSMYYKAWVPVVLNCAWLIIGIVTLIRMMSENNSKLFNS